MNIGSRINPIYIDLPEAICDDCDQPVDIESREKPCGCCGMVCTEHHTEIHHCYNGFGSESYRFTYIDWVGLGARALASHYRPDGL